MAQGFLVGLPQRLLTSAGAPAVGWNIATKNAGLSTDLITYSDAGLTSQNTNPIVTDSQGYFRAFVAAGAKGIVSAGFAPNATSPAETEALKEAIAQGVVVVQSSRAGSGRVFWGRRHQENNVIVADNLNPQKARILLSLALTKTQDKASIAEMFANY